MRADFDNNLTVDYNDLAFFMNYWLYDYNKDYQIWWWDYDDSGKVDMLDLQVIADYWLSPFDFYDFAEFAEQWQREIDGRYYDKRPDLVSDDRVDFKDFAALANEWRVTGDAEPNIVPIISGDPNNLGGDITVSTSINLPSIHNAWLSMDGQIIAGFGNIGEGTSSIIVKTNQYRNGDHSFKIICDFNDHFVLMPVSKCIFNNELSSITQPKGFEDGQSYYLYAISDSNYSVELYNNVNEVITFIETCEKGLNVHIPAGAFPERYGIYDLNISKQESQSQGMQMLSSDPPWVNEWVNYVITRKFDPADANYNQYIKMVISIGSEELQTAKEKCWKSAVKAAVQKGIFPVVLKYEDCTWDNLKFCLNLTNVKMWYHLSHGAYNLWTQPQRQCIEMADGRVFSYLKKDFDPNNIPPDYEELWWGSEGNHSIAELGLFYNPKMIWVQFNACYSARTPEFPFYLGMLGSVWPGNPLGNKVYIGWKNSAFVSDALAKYNQFEESYWDKLRQGYMLETAVMDSIPPGATYILNNFWAYGITSWQYAWFRYPNIN